MKPFISILIYFLLAIRLCPAQFPDAAAFQKLPTRPSFGVSDVTSLLPPRDKLALEERLRNIRKEIDAEIMIMILPGEFASASPSDVVMKRIVENWLTHDFCGIILHSPEAPGFPKVHISGASVSIPEIPSKQLRDVIAEIEENARIQNSSELRLDAALSSITKEMAKMRQVIDAKNAILQNEKMQQERAAQSASLQQETRYFVYVSMAASAAILIFLINRMIGKKFKVIHFPQTSPRKRFGAPYSGGAGGSISLNVPDDTKEKD